MSGSSNNFERDSKVASNPPHDSPDQLHDTFHHEDPVQAIEDFHREFLAVPATHDAPSPSQLFFPEHQPDNKSHIQHLEGQYQQPSAAEFVQILHTPAQLPNTEMSTAQHTAADAHISPVAPLANEAHYFESIATFPGPYEQQDIDEDVLCIHPSEFSTEVPSSTEDITTTDHQANPNAHEPEHVLKDNTQDSIRRSLGPSRIIQKRRPSNQRQTTATRKAHVRSEMGVPIPHGDLHEHQHTTLAEETEQQARDPYVPEQNTEPGSSELVIDSQDGEPATEDNVLLQEDNLLEYPGAPDLGNDFDQYKYVKMARAAAQNVKSKFRNQLKEEYERNLRLLEKKGISMDAKKRAQERSKRESKVSRAHTASFTHELVKYTIATATLEAERDHYLTEARKCREEIQKCREEAQKCRKEAQKFQRLAEWFSQFAPTHDENKKDYAPAQSTDASESASEWNENEPVELPFSAT